MADFARDLQVAFDGVVAAVRRSDAVNGLFSGSGLGKHFRASDADYIVSDFVGVVGDPAQLSSPLKEAP